MHEIKFVAGERRHIRMEVYSTANDPFVIRNARYELCQGDTLEEAGECRVDEHMIDAFIAPAKRNRTYTLRILYEIADETLGEEIKVWVV